MDFYTYDVIEESKLYLYRNKNENFIIALKYSYLWILSLLSINTIFISIIKHIANLQKKHNYLVWKNRIWPESYWELETLSRFFKTKNKLKHFNSYINPQWTY